MSENETPETEQGITVAQFGRAVDATTAAVAVMASSPAADPIRREIATGTLLILDLLAEAVNLEAAK